MKESDYFEMRGFGKTQVEGKKMKEETEKERVDRRLKNIIHNTGRIKITGCGAGNNRQTAKTGKVEQEYVEGSYVSKNKANIEEMVNAHWNYVEKLIMSSITDAGHLYSLAEVMEMRKWDYTSSAIHFYGHGYEDGQGAMAQTALDRLKGV